MLPISIPVASTSRLLARSAPLRTIRLHSTSSPRPSFAPSGSTSAGTEIPYGEPSLASSAYLPSQRLASGQAAPDASPGTKGTPATLTRKQRKLLEHIIRVDQAGELGANWIYKGQHAVLQRGKDRKAAGLVQEMWDGEKKHIATFDKLVTQHAVRPTLMYPLWKAMGFALGAGTAMMGTRAAMACTEAVETVIGEHYDSQLRALSLSTFPIDSHPSLPLLSNILEEFRDDELGHLDTAVENESQQAPDYALLSAVIATGCRVAISVTEKI